MRKKSMVFAAITTCLAFSMAACGKEESSSENAVRPLAEKAPVELTIYTTNTVWTPDEFREHFLDPVEKKYPYIKTKLIPYENSKQLEMLITAGTTPDIIFTSTGATSRYIMDYNLQFDMSELIKRFNYNLDLIDPNVVDLIREMSDGGIYSLPLYLSPNTIYYNKLIFDKFGVSYPDRAMTWDELDALSRRLTRNDGGVQYRGFLLSHNHLILLNQVSQRMLDDSLEKVAFDTDKFKNYLKNLVQIYTQPGYEMSSVPMANGKQNDMFIKEQTVAMIEPGAALYAKARIEPLGQDNWDFTYFPTLKGQPGVGYQPYSFLTMAITSTSKHKDAAFEMISHLTSTEYQAEKSKQGVLLPIMKNKAHIASFGQQSALFKGKKVEAIFPKQFAAVPEGIYSTYYDIATKHARIALENTFKGNTDINTAFRMATEAANKEIETKKSGK
ncbi:ABC transporter substrate-binding protein [Paenibacillus oceani]|uniref:Carbohydrate ABC transporter substrate-binding protein n=1 Tax=Paenibacillus oceani TaxID=2772510 RepID=A0A927C7I2_9BACL|nr:ABC transporter substrate-binding protein [Paenibacillus oceani]MBD2861457.1 carbohydrate ABC transporter substrate-binding protein [Paenibacillus oceani]